MFDVTSKSPNYLLVDESFTSPLFKAVTQASEEVVSNKSKAWIQSIANDLLIQSTENGRRKDTIGIISARVYISAKVLRKIFEKLPKERGDQFNNKIARDICTFCRIKVQSKDDFQSIMKALSNRVGKKIRKDIVCLLKKEDSRKLDTRLHAIENTGIKKEKHTIAGIQNDNNDSFATLEAQEKKMQRMKFCY